MNESIVLVFNNTRTTTTTRRRIRNQLYRNRTRRCLIKRPLLLHHLTHQPSQEELMVRLPNDDAVKTASAFTDIKVGYFKMPPGAAANDRCCTSRDPVKVKAAVVTSHNNDSEEDSGRRRSRPRSIPTPGTLRKMMIFNEFFRIPRGRWNHCHW
jgi:hypothetical protein